MSILSWNCRGLNASDSPPIPYLHWLLLKFKPSFLFLQETKLDVANVYSLLRSTNPSSYVGFDALQTRGGLVLFCWGSSSVEVIQKSSNFLLCKISEINGSSWHCLFLYGAPQYSNRLPLWQHLHHLLQPYSKYLIVGDINQVDHFSDKLGGSPLIRGWLDFVTWKMDLQLHDIAFSGPQFTKSNNRENEDLIMKRLDRGYASQDWMSTYPQTYIINLPILHSDHGPILLYPSAVTISTRRPYQVENWCLRYDEVKRMVHDIWQLQIVGSYAYVVARRLSILCQKLKAWCLDKKFFWGVNWKSIF